jgi:hypothetical protein
MQAQLAELDRAGSCCRPIRIAAVREGSPAEDRMLLVACRDRRSSVCPACSHTYKGDAWQVVATGMRGGKGVTNDVANRPRVFVTVTAPSFGPVHTRDARTSPARPCRMLHHRPGIQSRCRHGVVATCPVHHEWDDPLLGQPICPECFDYVGAVLWNAHVSVLWQRTAKRLVRALESRGKVVGATRNPEEEIGLRLSYVKAAEFQRRGLVHLHVVLRVDGKDGPDTPPPPWVDTESVISDITSVVPQVTTSVAMPSGTMCIAWGTQMAATGLVGGEPGEDGADDDRQMAVAAYVAKYATKTADATGALAHRIRARSEIAALPISDHQRRLVETAWVLGSGPFADLGLRRCANAFGYRGHVVTKSLRYSTTFTKLRGARAEYRSHTGAATLVGDDLHFGYAGRGYDDPATGLVAFHLARLATAAGGPPDDRDGGG